VSSHLHASRDGAGRWISILVGAAVIGLAAWLALDSDGTHPPPRSAVDAGPLPSASAAPIDAGAPATAADGEGDAGLLLPTLSLGDAGLVLPSSAPRSVKLGVVLVTFAGAEGAPATARSKKDALALAERLGSEARADFHKAVGSGDPGSADDVGRIPRGVLDGRTEVAVFGLGSGEVSDVLETARGFWIVKRID
jgi:hypothetical protein